VQVLMVEVYSWLHVLALLVNVVADLLPFIERYQRSHTTF
jgi:hypothetical protein